MYLIANQTRTDGKMLLRKAGYTGGIYREQYEGKIRDTFPVIELVLYWGNERWRSSHSIRRLFEQIPNLLPRLSSLYAHEPHLRRPVPGPQERAL